VLGDPARSTGRRLLEAALDGRAIAPGQRADFVVLHEAGFAGDSVLDHWLFSADNAAIRTVYCSGKPVVQNGRHVARDAIAARYRRVRR
jgi:cytosine/adenosine deaminase-related metal-dependent hydrolase